MTYLQLYIYRVQNKNREEFLKITREVNKIFRKYGTEGEQLFLLHDNISKYGTTGLWEILPTKANEEIWIGINHFKNTKHCDEVMKKFDADPETNQLYSKFINSVSSASRVIRGEFEKILY